MFSRYLLGLVLITLLPTAYGAEEIESVTDKIQHAFISETMGELPENYLDQQGVTVVTEHSITYSERSDHAHHANWKSVEAWLQGRKIERGVEGGGDIPSRGRGELMWCHSGYCLYSLEGVMAHNHIFLSEVWYRETPQGPRIYGLKIIDGD